MIVKIITICGSLKFQKEMMEMAEKMALDGNCVLTPTYPVSKNLNITDKQLNYLKKAHFKRIDLSDIILVMNVNNYIGESTSLEIEYATKLGKEIIYYSDLIKNWVGKIQLFICNNTSHYFYQFYQIGIYISPVFIRKK